MSPSSTKRALKRTKEVIGPGEGMTQTLLGGFIANQMNQVAGKCQHGFTKAKLHLTNLIALYGKVTCWVDVGQAMDIVCLCFSRAFSVISHSLVVKLLGNSLDKLPVQWLGT